MGTDINICRCKFGFTQYKHDSLKKARCRTAYYFLFQFPYCKACGATSSVFKYHYNFMNKRLNFSNKD